MTINELYAEYRKNRDERVLTELIQQGKRYCMHIYRKEQKIFWAVPREKALEIAEEQGLFCSNRCLREEVKCFKRCLISYFKWRMTDAVKKLIDEQKLTYAEDLKSELGVDETKVSDDEAISSAWMKGSQETEAKDYKWFERYNDLERYLERIKSPDAEIFVLCLMYSNEQVAKITGKSKKEVASAKCRVKRKLMEES